jgi:predicted permease
MKNQIKNSGVAMVIVLFTCAFTNLAFGQNKQLCEDIVAQIYSGINQSKANHLTKYLSKDFNMAGQKGDIALEIFPVYIASLKDSVTDIKKISEKQNDVLTLVYEAKFAEMGLKKSTFVFDKNNKLIKLDLLPTKVQNQKGK